MRAVTRNNASQVSSQAEQREGWWHPPLAREEQAGSEPGTVQLRLGVQQRDEPVSLPPAGEQSPVGGRVKRPMCGFSCKQDLELQRRVGLERGAGVEQQATCLPRVATELRVRRWLCSSPNPTPWCGHRTRAGASRGNRDQIFGIARDHKMENATEGLGDNAENIPQHADKKTEIEMRREKDKNI